MAFINNLIYLDNNATTKIDERVLESMLPFLRENYGNPASNLHAFGWVAQAAVEKATAQLSGLINCEPGELIFTSGATESVNLAIKGIYDAYRTKGNHIITCITEHKAVLDTCKHLEKQGASVTYLGVDKEGLLDPDELKAAIRPQTVLISIMAANNETGVMQPIEKIAGICQEKNITFFSDATQFVGKLRCDVKEMGIHCMALSAHKMYGPKGSGALFLSRKNPRISLSEQVHGGGHQEHRRSGTLNVPGIVGLGAAAEICHSEYWENSSHISKLKNYFEHQLLDIHNLRINGSTRHRLYNTSNITFPSHKKISQLLTRFAFSIGSACTSGSSEPSHVLRAMGINEEDMKNSYRFSFGRYNTLEEVKMIVEEIQKL